MLLEFICVLADLDGQEEPKSPDVGVDDEENVAPEMINSSNMTNPETVNEQQHVNVTGESDLSERYPPFL